MECASLATACPRLPVLLLVTGAALAMAASGGRPCRAQDPDPVAGAAAGAVAAAKLLVTCKGHAATLRALVFTPDGKSLVSLDRAGGVRVWEATGGKEVRAVDAGGSDITCVALSPDGALAAAGDENGQLYVYDVGTGKQRAHFNLPNEASTVHAVSISPDGRQLVTGWGDMSKRLVFWDLSGGSDSRTVPSHLHLLAHSPDGRTVAAYGSNRALTLWDAQRHDPKQALETGVSAIEALTFSRDGVWLAAGGEGGVELWRVGEKRGAKRLGKDGPTVITLAFSPDGSVLATGAAGEKVARLWDVATGVERARLDGHDGPVSAVAFSADGKLLATGGEDKMVRVWSLR
ncbi:MAG: WD40 repeat domain-containing protein [Planctomycetes bacterium]|nr:WD40 repeat domain-containing protein [Planctomycetota bacterium]